IQHNIPFLGAIMEHPRFRAGRITTGFIAEEYPEGFHGVELGDARKLALAAVAVFVNKVRADRAVLTDGQLSNWPRRLPAEWAASLEPWSQRARARETEAGLEVAFLDEEGNVSDAHLVESGWTPGQAVFTGTVDGEPLAVQLNRAGQGYFLSYRG